MTLRDILLTNASFTFEKSVFYQKEVFEESFEKKYVNLRRQEGRIYSDDVVQRLPEFDEYSALRKEWGTRKVSLKKLVAYLSRKEGTASILELGCGNGWLSRQLVSSLSAEVLGLDVNETELLQGAALFKNYENLSFMCADVFTVDIKKTFDIILMASTIQYFPNVEQIIRRLLELLNSSGEIHIVDSPIYNSLMESSEAKKRSHNYFSLQGVPEMASNYFHHTLPEFKSFSHQVLFNPNSLISLFNRKILRIPRSPFPWILIKHS